ncbi:hypothetical protein FW781_07215 (plasmid) [Chryseobacterium panacisoli]|uniref:Tissue inhibitor of metalloproteinase n=1 Tax=Chryseobacterium panacisoli TaxID=1807141 RepID=A0A5D8ZZ82_9FLAO|nr:hypothetical protein [Chryseobacterium panacisoli]TZF99710.1 hypothetical protein FW781_07215 [Chryseobacterium panacisoli]
MKKLSLLLFLLLSIIKVSACKCVFETLPQNYLNASIVGIIKIVRVYDEDSQQRNYKADVEFEKVYKGTTFKTMNVRGLIGNSYSGACEINVQPNERYLIFLKSDSTYVISSCTPKAKLGIKPTKAENLWLKNLGKAFTYLDNNKFRFIGLQFTSCYDETQSEYGSDLSKISKFKPKQPFAIYKVKIDDRSKIQEITPVTTFGSKDDTIENILKTNMIVSTPTSFWIPNQKEALLFLFYNKENIGKPYDEVISCD